jgi:glycosyltransferase involved in cell wall biosynthesis
MKNLVSVILTTFNEDFNILKKSLKSVLNQSYKYLELILILEPNDKNVLNINNIKLLDNRIFIYVNKKEYGFTKSLNVGVSKSRGNLIARIDSDDVWHSDKLLKQIKFMNENNFDVIGCDTNLVNEDRVFVGKRIYSKNNIKLNFLTRNGLCHPSVLLKKSCLEKYGSYDENFKCAEDLELWLRLLKNNIKFGIVPEILMDYTIKSNELLRNYQNWKFNFYARKKHSFGLYNPVFALISIALPLIIVLSLKIFKNSKISNSVYLKLISKNE